jgi:DNA-binding CsgD family transcriptional regulator
MQHAAGTPGVAHLDLDDALARLTPREVSVLVAAARGLTARQSGSLLGISHRTVESHRRAAYRKLGVHSALGTVGLLAAAGLLQGSAQLGE